MIDARAGRAAPFIVALFAFLLPALPAAADSTTSTDVLPQRGNAGGLPPYLTDRGRGMSTSQFGTYVRKGEDLRLRICAGRVRLHR
jgi:hypothetical protein